MLPGPEEWPVDSPLEYPTADLLDRRARSTPGTTAIVDAESNDRLTYAEFDERVSNRAADLSARLEGSGGRVGTLLDAGVGFAELYFATERLGGTLVPLNVRLDRETLASQVRRASLDVLVCGADTAEAADRIAPDGLDVVSLHDSDETEGWESVRGSTGRVKPVEASADRERLILFTSGTTGNPKGVRLTLGNLVSSAVGSADRLGVEPNDRWLVCLPMYHMGGLAPLVRSTLYGTTTVIQSGFDVDETARAIKEHAVTVVSLVPTMLTRLLDAGWAPPDSLRRVLLGGGPTPPSLVDRCEERGVPVCPTYGATETTSQVATALPETAFERRGTVGRPLSGTTVTIVDESDDPGDAGDVGEVAVEGPTVTPGYLDDDRTAAAFGTHGFRTGDLGYRDAAGHLWIVGRADDVIVTGGENVRPAKVAAVVREMEGVSDAVVLGIPDEEWGERVGALVERGDSGPSVASVRDHSREHLADYEVPKTVEFVGMLPRTASGTVDRETARAMLTDGR